MTRALIFLACIGCSSSNITTDDLDAALGQYDGVSDTENIKPWTGDWQYTSVDIASDTCSNLIDMLEFGSGFEVDRSGLPFTMTLDGSSAEASCLVGGDQFSCDPIGEVTAPQDSVTFNTTIDTRGMMYTTAEMEGVHELEVSCEGAGCSVLEVARDVNFPCRFGVFYTAAVQ